MAPEQLRGEDPDPSWDLWALAVIAFEMLCGSRPFASVTLAGLRTGGAGADPHLADLPQGCGSSLLALWRLIARRDRIGSGLYRRPREPACLKGFPGAERAGRFATTRWSLVWRRPEDERTLERGAGQPVRDLLVPGVCVYPATRLSPEEGAD